MTHDITITKLLDSVPKDVQLIIGKMAHSHNLNNVHTQLKSTYKIGMCIMTTKNTDGGDQRRKQIFAFLDIDHDILGQRSNFHELSKNIINIPDINGWNRTPYNYRNISGDSFYAEHVNPRIFCIRNGNRNVAVLPARYFYSKPIEKNIYKNISVNVESFIKTVPVNSYVRGGDL